MKYICHSKSGRCWSWCKDENTLALSSDDSEGKWCYTTNHNYYDGIVMKTLFACTFDFQCEDKNTCVTNCGTSCIKL